MRVLFLGAGAAMAAPALSYLKNNAHISQLVLSDLNEQSIPAFSLTSGNAVLKQAIDVTNSDQLLQAMKNTDLVINTTGPYYLLAETIVNCCIESGCHYVDICDDWEPTQRLLALSEAAKENGVTILLGAGISPGVSNLLAMIAASRLDSTEELYTHWSLAMDEVGLEEMRLIASAKKPSAAVVHLMQQVSGRILSWANGGPSQEKPLQKIAVEFPGRKTVKGFTVGHPEAITLPRAVPELKRSANVMVDLDKSSQLTLKAFSTLINLGLLSPARSAKIFKWFAKYEYQQIVKSGIEPVSEDSKMPSVFAIAKGIKDGKKTCVGVAPKSLPKGAMAEITGIPLGIFSALMLDESITQRGVITPEETGVESAFFDAIAPLAKEPFTGHEDLLLIRESNG